MSAIPIVLKIESSSAQNGDTPEIISLLTAGNMVISENNITILYQESLDDSQRMQSVRLTFDGNTLVMHREGDYNTDMVFRNGCRYEGIYETPFGEMEMGVFCSRLDSFLDCETGKADFHISYQLDLNGKFIASHEMHIAAESEKQ